jgi:hypothetical protein
MGEKASILLHPFVIRRILAEDGGEALKQIPGVMRPWRGLRVILDGEDGQLAMSHTFDGAVVQIQVRHLDLGWQAVSIYGKPVVLRSDFDLACRQIHNRLIATAMTELEFVSLAP